MDLRDAIAVPATLAFVALGFYGVVALRLRGIRRRASDGGERATRWRQLSPRSRLLRRTGGIILGIGAALILQVVIQRVVHSFSP